MYVVVHTPFHICRLLAFTPNTMYVVILYFLQPMYVGRGDFRSEKMAIKKYCDKIPRRAYGPLIKTKRKHQRYIRRFVFAGF